MPKWLLFEEQLLVFGSVGEMGSLEIWNGQSRGSKAYRLESDLKKDILLTNMRAEASFCRFWRYGGSPGSQASLRRPTGVPKSD